MKKNSLSAVRTNVSAILSKNKSGMTLVEVLGVFIVALIMMSFVFAMVNFLSGTSKMNQTQQSLAALSLGINGLYSGQGSYTGLNNTVVLRSGSVPQNLVKGNAITTPWGGAITVSADSGGTTFSIAVASLDRKACVFLATNQIDGWVSVSVNGNMIDKTAAVAGASTNCGDSGNTVTFVAR